MAVLHIHDLDDPRLEPYRALRDRVLKQDGGRFIAEGYRVTERLLASGLGVESILVAGRRLDEIEALVDRDLPIYTVSERDMERVAGFHIHTGVLSIGVRPPKPSLGQLLQPVGARPTTLVVCEKIKEPVNMGVIVRVAVALGASGMVIGPECVDPYYRRALRACTGTGFRLPIRRSDDLAADCDALRAEHGCEVIAAEVTDDAAPLRDTHRAAPDKPLAVVLGHEVHGVSEHLLAHCDRKAMIPMQRGADSLNVAICSAIFLYHFMDG